MRGVWPFNHRGIWIDPTTWIPQNYDTVERARIYVCREIDHHGFDWQVFLVAASGFFTDSYTLFATNVILPSLGYIYWQTEEDGKPELAINCATLAGSLLGQLTFGFLADKFGRRRLYGLELAIVIFSTLGMASASTGANNSMDFLSWIIFWRLSMGFAIGAEYPLSAVITAEFADVSARAKMMAAVFLMQPLGQICAAAVGWGVAASLSHGQIAADGTTLEDPTQTVDKIWRCVIGVGAFPALIAILYRVSIPESPRYTMDVSRDGKRALLDTNRYFAVQTDYDTALSSITSDNDGAGGVAEDEPPNYFTYRELREYFWVEGNWRYLVATSMCWFLLDFAFYGLGINSPIKLAAIWASAQSSTTTPSEDWQNPYVVNGKQIYNVLFENAKQYIITISTGSILGSVALILLIDKIPRIKWLIGSFIILALFFMITAATLSTVEFTPTHSLTIVFYTICQFFFNFGPNTLTFMIPAEIFPTRYRCTCHGISAAMGKLGSIFVQLVLFYINLASLNIALGIFSVLMASGAFFAWAWLPNVQREPDEAPRPMTLPTLPSKTLEELAKGRAYATGSTAIDLMTGLPGGEGQVLSLRRKTAALFAELWKMLPGKRNDSDSEHELHDRNTEREVIANGNV